jgi:hypothetical protein
MSLANYKRKCIENYKIANPGKEEQVLLDNIKGNVNINIEEIAKKQLQNILDINAMKNDIIELKNARDRMQAQNRLDIARFATCIHDIQGT